MPNLEISENPYSIDVPALESLPSLSLEDRLSFPNIGAVYFASDAAGTVLYIGNTTNLRQRFKRHHRDHDFSNVPDVRIAWYATESMIHRLTLEAYCCETLRPRLQDPSFAAPQKKRGPARRSKRMVDTHLHLPDDLLAWAKQQPEGFAGLVRRLLREEYERQARR